MEKLTDARIGAGEGRVGLRPQVFKQTAAWPISHALGVRYSTAIYRKVLVLGDLGQYKRH